MTLSLNASTFYFGGAHGLVRARGSLALPLGVGKLAWIGAGSAAGGAGGPAVPEPRPLPRMAEEDAA